jgi:hypothetical protein
MAPSMRSTRTAALARGGNVTRKPSGVCWYFSGAS